MWIVAIVVIVFVLLLYRHKEPFTGYWLADQDEFCQIAGVDSISLILTEPTGVFSKTSEGYLLIPDVFDGPISVKYMRGDKYNSTHVKMQGAEIWPEDLIFERKPGGILIIKDDEDHIYAKLYKNNELTYLGKKVADEED